MAAGGSISPSSLHDTEIYSTSPALKTTSKERLSSETPDRTQLEDTIPLPRPEPMSQRQVLRSSPPVIPASLQPIAAMSDVEDLSGNFQLSAKQLEEITRPPRCSSEVSTRHSENQTVIEALSDETNQLESNDDGSDWAPKIRKKAPSKAAGVKAAPRTTKIKNLRAGMSSNASEAHRATLQTRSTKKQQRGVEGEDALPEIRITSGEIVETMTHHIRVATKDQQKCHDVKEALERTVSQKLVKENSSKKPPSKHVAKPSFFDGEDPASTASPRATEKAATTGCK